MATALDRKERLLTQLRSMNDEAEKCGPDGRKAQASDQFRSAYAQVVMQLKQVRTALLSPQVHCVLGDRVNAVEACCHQVAVFSWAGTKHLLAHPRSTSATPAAETRAMHKQSSVCPRMCSVTWQGVLKAKACW